MVAGRWASSMMPAHESSLEDCGFKEVVSSWEAEGSDDICDEDEDEDDDDDDDDEV